MSISPDRVSAPSAILMLTSRSEELTPAELSMASVLIPPALHGEADASALGDAEIGAFAHDGGAQPVGGDAHAVIGAVTGLGIGLAGGADIGADAAEPQKVDIGRKNGADQVVGRDRIGGDAERVLRLDGQGDRFEGTRIDATALRDHQRIIVLPARPRHLEQTLALHEAEFGIGIGIDEDVSMVEGRDQTDLAAQQHAVAEHVARHVADADHGERFGVDVAVHLAEMALDRFPGAARRDAHLLVVVACGAARGEGIVEPETALGGDGIGRVGKLRRALVGGNDQIGIVGIGAFGVRRRSTMSPSRLSVTSSSPLMNSL